MKESLTKGLNGPKEETAAGKCLMLGLQYSVFISLTTSSMEKCVTNTRTCNFFNSFFVNHLNSLLFDTGWS